MYHPPGVGAGPAGATAGPGEGGAVGWLPQLLPSAHPSRSRGGREPSRACPTRTHPCRPAGNNCPPTASSSAPHRLLERGTVESYFERVTDVSAKSETIDLIVLSTSACQCFYFPFCLLNRDLLEELLLCRSQLSCMVLVFLSS